jgi:hypothetical protein
MSPEQLSNANSIENRAQESPREQRRGAAGQAEENWAQLRARRRRELRREIRRDEGHRKGEAKPGAESGPADCRRESRGDLILARRWHETTLAPGGCLERHPTSRASSFLVASRDP